MHVVSMLVALCAVAMTSTWAAPAGTDWEIPAYPLKFAETIGRLLIGSGTMNVNDFDMITYYRTFTLQTLLNDYIYKIRQLSPGLQSASQKAALDVVGIDPSTLARRIHALREHPNIMTAVTAEERTLLIQFVRFQMVVFPKFMKVTAEMTLSNSPILDGSTLTEEDIKILNPDVNESQLLQIFPSGRFSGEQGTSLDLLMPPTPQERSETVKDLGSRNGHQPDHLTDEAIGI